MITTTNGNLELRELLQEVNEMMLTFRKLEIDIEKKNNSLQKTIVNISHDLKTPLTSALPRKARPLRHRLEEDPRGRQEVFGTDGPRIH